MVGELRRRAMDENDIGIDSAQAQNIQPGCSVHRAPVSAKGVGSMRARSAIRDALDHADGWLCYFSAAAATPLSLTYARDCVRPGTGGSASPPFSGFALVRRCTVSRLHGQSCIGRFRNGSAGLPQCLHQETSAQCQHQKTQRERDVSAQCAHTRTFRHRCVMHVAENLESREPLPPAGSAPWPSLTY
jgi:hypothetical protein